MFNFILRRLLLIIVTLWAVSLIIFCITIVLPGDAAVMTLGMEATAEDLETLRHRLGIDRPKIIQYIDWVGGVLKGDLGMSIRYQKPIAPLLAMRVSNSLWLTGVGLLISIPIGLLFGIIGGLKPGRLIDHILSGASLYFTAMPEFVTGAVLITLFSTKLGWFPPFSEVEPGMPLLDRLYNLFLPAVTLSLVIVAYTLRMMRASLIEVMQSMYIRAAKLKGLPWPTLLFRHALPPALGPTITVIALSIGWMIGGLVIVESMFGYPGLGRLLIYAIDNRDIPLIQAISLIVACAYAFANLFADIACKLIDSRIKD
ncbi:MAG: ABC transporter permease [Bacteroidetes bacterium]|jgi:peptide/nickel transport system permease protein|nr:ABC transporter permease [Bacteroidota bacterium]